ncbi:MAG: hypothetical protein E6767_12585 [Dysgonomonas sp.]|nr:hypothetical protein [Dysgonomonas sp.]
MMNTILRYIGAFILPVFLLTLVGCEDKDANYVRLSSSSFTFSPEGTETFEIKVEASKSWTVEYVGDWVVEKEKDNSSIKIGATATQSNSDRLAQLVFRAGDAVEVVNVSQLGTNVGFSMMDNNSLEVAVSTNGRYVAGVNSQLTGESSYEYTPFIIDLVTGKRTTKKVLKKNTVAVAISDNGTLVLMDETTWTTFHYDESDEIIIPKLPAGYKSPTVQGISADGKIMVGYARKESDRLDYPVKWTNGNPEILPVPEKTGLGELLEQGAMARGCSADGSVIYGSIWDDKSAIYWKDGKVGFVGADKMRKHTINVMISGSLVGVEVLDRPILYAETANMSPNGKYLAVTFRKVESVDNVQVEFSSPAVFDVENETLTILTEYPSGFEDGAGRTVSDKGMLSFSCPAQASTTGFIYNMNSKSVLSTSAFIKQDYGFSFTTEDAIITRIVNDGRVLLGLNVLVRGSSIQYWYINVMD